MRVKIYVRDQGVKNNPKYWVIAQPMKKNLKGKYLDHLGTVQLHTRRTVMRNMAFNRHRVNYWLANGAICTPQAQRILSRYGMMPPLPKPLGSAHGYEKPERESFEQKYFRPRKLMPKETPMRVAHYYKQKLQEQMNLVERRRMLQSEALGAAGGELKNAASAIATDDEDTDGMDSDDPDIFERSRKFERILKKMDKHRAQTQLALKGNDLRYNVYLKKLKKLSRKDLGLDILAYKDYVNNLKEFAHLNRDINLLAAEQLLQDDPSNTGYATLSTSASQPEIRTDLEGEARLRANQRSIRFTLGKFLRTGSGFIQSRDQRVMAELEDNLVLYMTNDPKILQGVRKVYEKSRRLVWERQHQQLMVDELLGDVPTETLQRAKVTRAIYKSIKDLIKLDKDIFQEESEIHLPNDLLRDNPYAAFVNFERLPKEIPPHLKSILFRPQYYQKIKKAYFRLAHELQHDYQRRKDLKREVQFNFNIKMDRHQRKPVKTQEELDMMENLSRAVDRTLKLINEDGYRELEDALTSTRVPILAQDYTDWNDWFNPHVASVIAERRKIPKADRLRLFREDSVDEIDTTDLENWEFRGATFRLGQADTFKEKMKREMESDMRRERREAAEAEVELPYGKRDIANMNDEELYERDLIEDGFGFSDDEYPGTGIYGVLEDSEDEKNLQIDKVDAKKLGEAEDILAEEEEESESDLEAEHLVKPIKRTKQELLVDGEPDALPGYELSEQDKIVSDVNLKKELMQLGMRHRIDWVKWFFGKDGGYTIKQLKRMYKTEMQESPERYSLKDPEPELRTPAKLDEKAIEDAFQKALREGDRRLKGVSQERARQITAYSSQLDRWIASLKDDATASELFGSFSPSQSSGSARKAKLAELRSMHAENISTTDSVKDFVLTAEVRAQMARRDEEMLQRFQTEVDLPAFKELTEDLIVKLESLVEFKLTAPPPELEEEEEPESLEGALFEESDQDTPDEVLEDIAATAEPEESEAPAAESRETNETAEPKVAKDGEEAQEGEAGGAGEDEEDVPLLEQLDVDEIVSLISTLRSELKTAKTVTAGVGISAEIRARVQEQKLFDKETGLSRFEQEHLEMVAIKEVEDLIETKEEILADEELTEEEKAQIDVLFAIDEDLMAWYEAKKKSVDDMVANLLEEAKEEGAVNDEDFDEEAFEAAMNELGEKEFETQEEMDAYYNEIYNKLVYNRIKEHYPHYKPEFLKPKEPFADASYDKDREYKSKTLHDLFLDQENWHKMFRYDQERVGQYAPGYRHFMSYTTYSHVNPEATQQDYIQEMHRPCEFHEFADIVRAHIRECWNHPDFRFGLKSSIIQRIQEDDSDFELDERDVDDTEDLEEQMKGYLPHYESRSEFLSGERFTEECRRLYQDRVQSALLKRDTYKFIDALEESLDFWHAGADMYHIPNQNAYLPVRSTIMKKPNLLDEDLEDDELGYIFNDYSKNDQSRKKWVPGHQQNPMLAYRLSPGFNRHHYDRSKMRPLPYATGELYAAIKPSYRKWRRLSRIKSNSFATDVRAYAHEQPLSSRLTAASMDCGVSLPARFTIPSGLRADPTPFRQ